MGERPDLLLSFVSGRQSVLSLHLRKRGKSQKTLVSCVPAGVFVDLSKGARLGPYEVIGMVGKGGMGEVYRAVDTRLGHSRHKSVIRARSSASGTVSS